jgi:hypothetical protein
VRICGILGSLSSVLTYLYIHSDIQIYTPFAVDSVARDTHITFLDTKGRPSIIFAKRNLTEKHTSLIYVRALNFHSSCSTLNY